MLKRVLSAVFVLSLFVLLTAMGGKGGGFERAPRVDKNFTVVVTDASGNKITGEKFSWEGRVRFSGYLGLAEVNLPFDRIKELTVGEKKEKKVRVTAHLVDGSETVVDVDADSRCYGEAGFGSFMLTMDEIKAISFKGVKEMVPEARH
jgi:hypothetical protein